MPGGNLRMYVIYARPEDYPDSYVVRGWSVGVKQIFPDSSPIAVVPTMVEARKALPPGVCQMSGGDKNDPTIVGVWM